jgi:SAM-dependent methyltransferase
MTADLSDAPDIRRAVDVTRMDILRGILAGFTPGRAVDLACGTGLFAETAAAAGWQVTAVDVRRREWPPHPRVTYLQQDVRDADLAGYDLVLCLGVFYHLTLPDQVALLAKCAGTPLVLDTHVSLHGGESEDGYDGHYYPEDCSQVLSAWGNDRSWWPAEASLRRMLAAAGYRSVTALEPWYHGEDRTFFTCLP